MNEVFRIAIRWDGSQYKVSKPEWDGGVMVYARDYDALEQRANRAAFLLRMVQPSVPAAWAYDVREFLDGAPDTAGEGLSSGASHE